MISVDLGCGELPRNPYNCETLIGVDLHQDNNPNYRQCLLGFEPLPFEDQSIDRFSAYDVIEHIPRFTWRDGKPINPFLYLMSDIYRCLSQRGIFYAATPAYPHAAAFQDPTHVNIITDETVYYFCPKNSPPPGEDPNLLLKHCNNYGFRGKFNLLSQRWQGVHLIWELEKPEANG